MSFSVFYFNFDNKKITRLRETEREREGEGGGENDGVVDAVDDDDDDATNGAGACIRDKSRNCTINERLGE